MEKPKRGAGRWPANQIVDPHILEQIVTGGYSADLSEEEQSLLARVPVQLKPWVEEVVVGEFYLPLRGVIWYGEATLAGLIAELLPAEAAREFMQDDQVHEQTLREIFNSRRERGRYSSLRPVHGNMTFEEAVRTELLRYRGHLVGVIKRKLEGGEHYYPITYSAMMKRLGPNLKG